MGSLWLIETITSKALRSILLFIYLFIYLFIRYISAISWRSVLLVEETVVPGENHRLVSSHRVHLAWPWFEVTK
jgi:hypothetical protein